MLLVTQREYEVVLGMLEGIRPEGTAKRYGLSVKSVSTYRARIMARNGTTTDAQVGYIVARLGMAVMPTPGGGKKASARRNAGYINNAIENTRTIKELVDSCSNIAPVNSSTSGTGSTNATPFTSSAS